MHNMGTWPHYKFTVLHNGWSAQRWGQTTRLAASPALGVTKPAGSNGERPVLISRHSGKPDLTLGRAWPHEKKRSTFHGHAACLRPMEIYTLFECGQPPAPQRGAASSQSELAITCAFAVVFASLPKANL